MDYESLFMTDALSFLVSQPKSVKQKLYEEISLASHRFLLDQHFKQIQGHEGLRVICISEKGFHYMLTGFFVAEDDDGYLMLAAGCKVSQPRPIFSTIEEAMLCFGLFEDFENNVPIREMLKKHFGYYKDDTPDESL